ncbi:MAG: hypothetical protein ACKO01_13160 [Erythrobacter sp.]
MLALGCAIVSASGALATNGARWQLEAHVPVICAILAVEAPGNSTTGLAVATSCNAERYQLRVSGVAALRAAYSSAGPVAVSGSAVTITSSRPGYALTTIELAEPVAPGQLAVTLQPI